MSDETIVRRILMDKCHTELVELVIAYRMRWLITLGTYEPGLDDYSEASLSLCNCPGRDGLVNTTCKVHSEKDS